MGFKSQVVLGKFIVDFFHPETKLAVEVDGEYHDYKRKRDQERTDEISRGGVVVVRFTNKQVMKDRDTVVAEIKKQLDLVSSQTV